MWLGVHYLLSLLFTLLVCTWYAEPDKNISCTMGIMITKWYTCTTISITWVIIYIHDMLSCHLILPGSNIITYFILTCPDGLWIILFSNFFTFCFVGTNNVTYVWCSLKMYVVILSTIVTIYSTVAILYLHVHMYCFWKEGLVLHVYLK